MMSYKPRKIEKNTKGRIIAIGDIHGCYWTLKKLLETKINLKKDDQLFLLGDLIDKGNNSKLVLEYLQKLIEDNYEIYPIMGNHETMLLSAYNSGFAFFEEYLEKYNSYDLLDGDLYKYIEFIYNFDYCIEIDEFIMSHPGINDNRINPFTDLRGMFPEMKINLSAIDLESKIQIHGHTLRTISEINYDIENNTRRISIDSGCVENHNDEYGNLTGLDLRKMEIFTLKNIEN